MAFTVVVSWSTDLDWQVLQGSIHEQHVMPQSWLTQPVQVCLHRCTINSQLRDLGDGGSWHSACISRTSENLPQLAKLWNKGWFLPAEDRRDSVPLPVLMLGYLLLLSVLYFCNYS